VGLSNSWSNSSAASTTTSTVPGSHIYDAC